MDLRCVIGIQSEVGGSMSFSGDVKDELVRLENDARHCQIAELAAVLVYAGTVKTDVLGVQCIELPSDSSLVVRRGHMLFDRLFGEQFFTEKHLIQDEICVRKVLQTIKYSGGELLVNPLLIKSFCCKRAFLRGTFLAVGSMSNPEKGYHWNMCVQMHSRQRRLWIRYWHMVFAQRLWCGKSIRLCILRKVRRSWSCSM